MGAGHSHSREPLIGQYSVMLYTVCVYIYTYLMLKSSLICFEVGQHIDELKLIDLNQKPQT